MAERKTSLIPKKVNPNSDGEDDVISLDSDEERCKIVDERNAQDKHFFC